MPNHQQKAGEYKYTIGVLRAKVINLKKKEFKTYLQCMSCTFFFVFSKDVKKNFTGFNVI